MQKKVTEFNQCLKILSEHRVDFIIVGGICAVLHGAPVTTFDLDIVHSRTSENLERLVSALEKMDAYYRGRPGPKLKPDSDCLASPGHHLLMTDYGPLDVLGTIGSGYDYETLLADSEKIQLDDMEIRLLSLEQLIKTKKDVHRQKDQMVIEILKDTLNEKRRKHTHERDE